ncbi:MAG: hypothetical protein ACJ79K_03640 [Gemmatimonadaceae bacterium]
MKHPCLTFVALLLVAPCLRAQVTERPVPFDSIGRVPTITEPLAARLRLAPPAWPVLGSFVRAQLFARSTGGYTLVVARADGSLDRYELTGEQADALRGVVVSALASGQRAGVGEQTSVASDPAGNAFVRNQALLGLFLYGPSAALVVGDATNDGKAALSAELLTVSGAFAAALARRNASPPVTTAQNNLSTSAAIHGAAIGEALVYAAGGTGGEVDATAHGAALLAGSVGGSILGMRFARRMTDAEASSSAYAADFTAAASLGVMGAAGALERESSGRAAAAIASAAMIGGYVVGPSYPRRASYTVTAGDVRAMTTTTLIGIAAAATPFIGRDRPDARALSVTLTGGTVVGALAGDRWLVRPRDHTASDGALLMTGAGVGAVVGGGVASLGDASSQPAWGLAVTGALLGMIATEAAVRPLPGGRRILSSRGDQRSARGADDSSATAHGASERRMKITIDPIGVAFAATSRIGTFSVLRVSF